MNSETAMWHHQQVAILIIVVVVAAFIVMYFWRSAQKANQGEESAEDILKRRYASGEIDDETYQRMLKELRK